MWIKVWVTWAWGSDKNSPDYYEVETNDDIEDVIHTVNESNEWSDKYRGAKYEVIDAPPVKWLVKEIEDLEYRSKQSANRAEYLKKLLKEVEIPLPR